jgi:phospholipase/lecithinase/hemolysin
MTPFVTRLTIWIDKEALMRFRILGGFLCVALLLGASHVRAQLSQLYIFGDSLTDTGNLASIRFNFPPPFFMNRVSNGPVAVETLAALLGLEAHASLHLIGPAQGTNYAVAGATARGSEAIDLTAQVGAFLQNHGQAAPPDALYVLMIGGNDVREARDAEDMAAQAILTQATAAIGTHLETLATAGAMRFLVVNVADLGAIPETRRLAEATGMPSLVEIATLRTETFNQVLADEVNRLRTALGLKIALVDLFTSGRAVIRNANAYDLENLTDACFLIINNGLSFHPDCENGANFDAFAYFDDIHPTAKEH